MKNTKKCKVKKKPDYNLKAHVLTLKYMGEPLTELMRKIHYSLNFPKSNFGMSNKTACEYLEILEETFTKEELDECKRLNKSFYARLQRLRDRINDMLQSNCLFLTLTFTNERLENTTAKARREYIRDYLNNQNGLCYIANVDYGKVEKYVDEQGEIRIGTHREHYHAIIQTERVNPKDYKWGNIDIERVYVNTEPSRLAKYVNKLTNHAVKATTKRQAVIYSRQYQKKLINA